MGREVEIAILQAKKKANLKKELVIKEEIDKKIESVDTKASTAIELSTKVMDSLEQTNHALETIRELPVKVVNGKQGKEGKPGEDGYTPVKNIDYFDGKDGKPGKNGIDGKDGKDGKPGKNGIDGKDGSPDTPYEVRDKLSTLKGRERLDAKHIQNIDKYVSLSVTQTMGGGQGGGNSYVLPKASGTVLGGVKVGDRLTIDTDGVLSADVQTGATGVQSIVSGNDIAIDNTDPANPTVSFVGTIPTSNSQLTNDSNFITSADIPPIPDDVSDLTDTTGLLGNATKIQGFDVTETDPTDGKMLVYRTATSEYVLEDKPATGTGDVIAPATNTDSYIPQWDGANSKTLKDGLAVPAGGLASADTVASLVNQRTITKDPTGFLSPQDVIVTYDQVNLTITLTGTMTAYYRGVSVTSIVPTFTSGWTSAAHTDAVGVYFLYFDGANFQWGTSFPDFSVLQIAIVNKRATTSFASRECHGFMPWQSHLNAHYNIGTFRSGGGDITNLVLASTTADNRRPIISDCTINDEDCATVNATLTSKKYSQRFITDANTINYTLQANDIVPLSTNRPYYNSFTTPNYGQTLMPANSVMTVWLFEVPATADSDSQEIRHVFVQGQSITQATNASAGALVVARNTEKLKTSQELNLGVAAVVAAEFVCIQKFIIQYTSSNWTITDSIAITGSRANQVASPSGSYLTSVSTDSSLTGNGTALNPLHVVADSEFTIAMAVAL